MQLGAFIICNAAQYDIFFHAHLWFPASDRDFWQFGIDFWSSFKVITEKNIVEEIEFIMGAHAEQISPEWVCVPKQACI